jgi:hypothetical protein
MFEEKCKPEKLCELTAYLKKNQQLLELVRINPYPANVEKMVSV